MDKTEKTIEDVKKEIRSLLISSPVGLRLQDLLSDYRAMIGRHLPFKEFGYSSDLEMIKHMPDVVRPVFRPGGTMFLEAIPDKQTMHIKRLVLKQKRTGKVSRIQRPRDESIRYQPPKPALPAILRMKIKELLRPYPNGLDEKTFASFYAKRFGRDIDFQKYGYATLNRLLRDCSDIIDMITTEKDGKKLSIFCLKTQALKPSIIQTSGPKSPQSKAESKQMQGSKARPASEGNSRALSASNAQKQPGVGLMDLELEDNTPPARKGDDDSMILTQTGVSDQLKSEIKSLLEGKKNGIWLARFPFEYKKQFSKELDVKTAGYLSLITLMGSLPDIVRIDRPVQNGDWLLHGVGSVHNSGAEDPIPKDAVKYDGIIQRMPFPVQGQMEIFIVQIENPGDFYFHWFQKKEALYELMNIMSDFYKSVSSQCYILPVSQQKTGQVCAAIYDEDNDWYRAIISRVLSENEVEVVYADYGNKAKVNPANLRLLKKEFIELPAMCIMGRLAKIKPLQSNWTSESATRFFQLTKDKKLLGKIHEVKDNIVSLDIVDTSAEYQVHVNDTLVVERLAGYIQPPLLPNPMYGASFPNFLQSSPLLPLQNPYYRPMQMGMNPLLQQALMLYPRQLTTMGLCQPLSLGQKMLPPQQPLLNPGFHRSASFPTQANAGELHRQASQVVSEPESLESFINKINLELDDKCSLGGSTSDEENNASAEELSRNTRIIKKITCKQYRLHIINYDGAPFVTRGEISALFWHKDILRQMLHQQKVSVQPITISREECTDLFNELKREKVKDFVGTDDLRESLTLYELESLPLILNTFKHQSKELREMIDEEVALYKGSPEQSTESEEDTASDDDIEEDTASDDDIEEDSMTLELELEELRLLLQALQFRRKRLVNSMISRTSCAEKVNELKSAEEEIERIRKKIQMKEGNKS